MSTSEPVDATCRWTRACVALTLLTVDLTALAADALGRSSTRNRDIQVLLLLGERPGSSPSEMADLMGVSRSSLSRTVRRLMSQDLVVRRRDERDGRAAHLWLTPAAMGRLSAFESAFIRYVGTGRSLFDALIDLTRGEKGASRSVRVDAAELTPLAVLGLLAEVGAITVEDIMTVAPSYGLEHSTDRAALMIIHERGPVRPSHLAASLHLTSGGATLLVDRLAHNGLVDRLRPQEASDRRGVLVVCTPRGHAAAAEICSVISRHGEDLATAFDAVVALAPADAPAVVDRS